MSVIRKLIHYVGSKKVPTEVHPLTEVAAIVDLPQALDSYVEQFILPEVDEKINAVTIQGPPGPQGKQGDKGEPGDVGLSFATLHTPTGCPANCVALSRQGNTVQFDFNSGATNVSSMASPTVTAIPLGYRPFIPYPEIRDYIELFVGLSGNGKACTLKIYGNGSLQVTMPQAAPVQTITLWVTKDPYPV